MNWYLQSGKDSDVVVSSKIKLSRNLVGFPFKLKNQKQIQELEEKIQSKLYAIGYGLKYFSLKNMDDITKVSLVEKNLIPEDYAFDKNCEGSILINDEENICILINDLDHIEIQLFSSGLDLENTLGLAIEIDQKIEDVLGGYAVSEKYGYLTKDPTKCGTALNASVMLNLPALQKTGNLRKVFDAMANFEVNISAFYEENAKQYTDIFKICNQRTIGISEKEIIENLKIIVQKIIEQERKVRRFLAEDSITFSDKIYRSYGILKYCKRISLDEVTEIMSYIKMGVDLGILKEVTDLQVQKLYLYTKTANMQKVLGQTYEPKEQEKKRAEVIKQILDGTLNV